MKQFILSFAGGGLVSIWIIGLWMFSLANQAQFCPPQSGCQMNQEGIWFIFAYICFTALSALTFAVAARGKKLGLYIPFILLGLPSVGLGAYFLVSISQIGNPLLFMLLGAALVVIVPCFIHYVVIQIIAVVLYRRARNKAVVE